MRGRMPKDGAVRRGLKDRSGADEPRRGVRMPADIEADLAKSEIWELIAPPVNNFCEQDVPTLRMLVQWHAVFQQACQEMAGEYGALNVLEKIGETEEGGVPLKRKHPAIAVMKTASTEIRALSDQLGLSPLARTRIGLMDAVATKTAADTAKMFQSIDAAYAKYLPAAEAEVVEVADV